MPPQFFQLSLQTPMCVFCLPLTDCGPTQRMGGWMMGELWRPHASGRSGQATSARALAHITRPGDKVGIRHGSYDTLRARGRCRRSTQRVATSAGVLGGRYDAYDDDARPRFCCRATMARSHRCAFGGRRPLPRASRSHPLLPLNTTQTRTNDDDERRSSCSSIRGLAGGRASQG